MMLVLGMKPYSGTFLDSIKLTVDQINYHHYYIISR